MGRTTNTRTTWWPGRIAAAATWAGLLAGAASAQVTFGPLRLVTTSPVLDPLSFSVSDLDGDGRPEVPYATMFGAGILANLGDGILSGLTWQDSVSAPRVLDADGDGLLDLLMTLSTQFDVRLGDGEGGFGPPVLSDGVIPPGLVGVANLRAEDVTGDGLPDLLTQLLHFTGWKTELLLYHGLGGGRFAPGVLIEQGPPVTRSAFVDADGDGDTDALLWLFAHGPGDEPGVQMHVQRNDGGGSFHEEQLDWMPGSWELAPVDVNADGLIDLLSETDGQGILRLGLGDLTFAPPISAYSADAKALYPPVASADLDGDGALDLLRYVAPELQFWLGDGAGAFTHVGGLELGAHWREVQTADINADGRPDLIAAVFDGGHYSFAIALNTTFAADSPFHGEDDALLHPNHHALHLADGPLTPGSDYAFALSDPPQDALAWLVVGTSLAHLPHAGGFIGPALEHIIGPVPMLGLQRWTLDGAWPASAPSGLQLHTQFWVRDADGLFSSSDTVTLVVP